MLRILNLMLGVGDTLSIHGCTPALGLKMKGVNILFRLCSRKMGLSPPKEVFKCKNYNVVKAIGGEPFISI